MLEKGTSTTTSRQAREAAPVAGEWKADERKTLCVHQPHPYDSYLPSSSSTTCFSTCTSLCPVASSKDPWAQLHLQKRTRTAHCSHTAAASQGTASLAFHSQTAASASLPSPSSSRGRPPLSFDDNCSCKNAQGSTAWWSGTTASSHESLNKKPQAIL
jgi:hypothetical protein